MAALDAIVERMIGGRGGVVDVVGPPGIGKSRVAREAAALAAGRGVDVFWGFCESHARDVPFYAVARLLRAGTGVADLDGEAARAGLRAYVPDTDPQDLLLLDDLLGIADPDVALPAIDPDARRRRLTALVNATTLARTEPALFIIEDVHWIDAVSESMLADFLSVIPRTPTMVLITSRPEYEGALTRVHGAQTIALAPLGDSDTAALLGELLGSDPSVGELAANIAERAAGNPFFAEEMVRELAQRGVLAGERGGYVCRADVAESRAGDGAGGHRGAHRPAEHRGQADAERGVGDRRPLRSGPARRAGHRCGVRRTAQRGADRSGAVHPERRIRLPPPADPRGGLRIAAEIRSRRVAPAPGRRDPRAWPGSVEDNAALIAEHLEAAGELHAAYGWHMRAATWATNRDIAAARLSWERARKIADALPADDPDRAAMRIAPRTMLCGTAWRVHVNVAGAGFDELRELCTAAGDKASLAIAMAGLVIDHAYHARIREASQLASEAHGPAESIGDPDLTVGLCVPVIYAKTESAEYSDMLRWTQRVIDLADGDPAKGDFLIGSPLSFAYASRAIARYCLGRPGWRDDLRHGLAIGRSADPVSYAGAVALSYFGGIPNGVLRPDDSVVREIEDALRIAERSGDDLAVTNVRMALGMALAYRDTAAQRDRGQQILAEVGDVFVRREHNMAELPIVNVLLVA